MVKINKTIATILLVATIVLSATAVSAAKTEVKKIEFNLDQGSYSTYDPVTKMWTYVPASAIFNGNIKNTDDKFYLSPQNGIIKIDGVDNNIQLKGAKQSEPIAYFAYEYGTPGSGYYEKYESWSEPVEVNIGGHKSIGFVNWYKDHWEYFGSVYDFQGSNLYFSGVVDGKPVSGSLWSMNLPVIS